MAAARLSLRDATSGTQGRLHTRCNILLEAVALEPPCIECGISSLKGLLRQRRHAFAGQAF